MPAPIARRHYIPTWALSAGNESVTAAPPPGVAPETTFKEKTVCVPEWFSEFVADAPSGRLLAFAAEGTWRLANSAG
jgi:hypothetical protein